MFSLFLFLASRVDAMSRFFCMFLLLLCFCVGCQQPVDPAVTAQREKYLLSEEPSGAVGVLEARELVAEQVPAEEEGSPPTKPVVLLGRIGSNPESTWDPGVAKFVIRDPAAEMEEHDHGPGHDPDNCPFCKAKKEKSPDMTALVQVVDAEGQVVGIDARKLFSVDLNQLVVVRGQAQIDSLGNLIVSADGVYIRQ